MIMWGGFLFFIFYPSLFDWVVKNRLRYYWLILMFFYFFFSGLSHFYKYDQSIIISKLSHFDKYKNMTLYNVQWLIVNFIKAFIKQGSMIIILLSFSSFFSLFKNEMDDWEENEEFRTIEGLEGKYCPVQTL